MQSQSSPPRLRRGSYLGGHQIGAILGAHPFMTVHDVWSYAMTGETEDISEQPAVRRGRIIEPGFLDYIENRCEGTLERDKFVVDAEVPYFAGTVDAIESTGVLHEVTSVTSRSLDKWGRDGDPEGAAAYKFLQSQWYMGITGLKRACIWLFVVDTGDIRHYPFLRDNGLIAKMRAAGENFWLDHVVGGKPPEAPTDIAGLAKMCPALDMVYVGREKREMEASAELISAAEDYDAARAAQKMAEERKFAASARLKLLLEENTNARWDMGSVSWSRTKDSVKLNYDSMIMELSKRAGIDDVELAQMRLKHTVQRPGARVMRVTMRDGDAE